MAVSFTYPIMLISFHVAVRQTKACVYTVGVKQSHNIEAMFLYTNLTLHMLFYKSRINILHSLKHIPGTEINGSGPAYQPYFGFVEEIPVPTAQEHSAVQFHLLQCVCLTVFSALSFGWISHQSSHKPRKTIITFVLVILFTVNIKHRTGFDFHSSLDMKGTRNYNITQLLMYRLH